MENNQNPEKPLRNPLFPHIPDIKKLSREELTQLLLKHRAERREKYESGKKKPRGGKKGTKVTSILKMKGSGKNEAPVRLDLAIEKIMKLPKAEREAELRRLTELLDEADSD